MTQRTGYSIGEFSNVEDEIRRLDSQANVIGRLEDQALQRLGVPTVGRGLDVGCGPGFVAQRLRARYPALELVGYDPYPAIKAPVAV